MKYPVWEYALCGGCRNYISRPSFMGGTIWVCGRITIPDICYEPKGEAVDIIDGLVEIAQTRQLTSSESDQLHAAKMALPTFAEERAAAVQRIKERVEKRRHES